MILTVIAIVLLAGSIGVIIAAIIGNQIDPDYSSALAIPLANLTSLALALLALLLAVIAYRKNKEAKLAKTTMILALAVVVALALMFPLADAGYLSAVR